MRSIRTQKPERGIDMVSKKERRFVLVTTEQRGVFAGYLKEDEGKEYVVLEECRCAIYWATTRGFIELATIGPNEKSTIGAKGEEIKLYNITSVVKCTKIAQDKWCSYE